MNADDVNALFLGPKAENEKFFKEMLNFLIENHIEWRQCFHCDDPPLITPEDHETTEFKATIERTRAILTDLACLLQAGSIPWFSPRYLGHMNSDTLMAANLAYILTLLYNPNNCAYESSPATTRLEIQVGKQLAEMLGYDPSQAFGHITSGGTVANYEGLWVARNMKSFPPALREITPELVEGLDEWQLLNLSVKKILELMDTVKKSGIFEEVRNRSARGIGVPQGSLGKLLVPQTKHYSWKKAVDILGIGEENLINIRVKSTCRMDVDHLRETIDGLIKMKTPVLGVVAVVGTTEEGAIDEIQNIAALRDEYESKGVSFYFHIDAAFGGYGRALFLDEQYNFIRYDDLKKKLHDEQIIEPHTQWPTREIYESFKAVSLADSITIDPHKMGYIPYAAGAIVMKDRRVVDLISYFAAYVFEKFEKNPILLGSFIMEGSKAGAAAASVWTAHRVVPLNITGYGRIIGCTIDGAQHFYHSLLAAELFVVNDRTFRVSPLTEPDFNIVNFLFHEEGTASLEKTNRLNQVIYERCSYKSGPLYTKDFITSKTSLSYEEYGDVPAQFITTLGIPLEEWNRVKYLYVLRACVLTPYLAKYSSYEEYWNNFLNTMRKTLAIITAE